MALAQAFQAARAGYSTDGHGVVTEVVPGSPAAAAGLAPGDHVVAVNGVTGLEARVDARLGPPGIGERRTLEVQRGNESLAIEVGHAPLSAHQRGVRISGVLLGFWFVGATWLAFWRRGSRGSRLLAIAGLGIGLGLMGDAGLAGGALRAGAMVVRNALVLGGVAAALRFVMMSARPAPFIERPHRAMWLFVPLAAFWLLLIPRNFFMEVPVLWAWGTDVLGAALVGAYLAAGAVILLRAYIRNRAAPRPNRHTRLFWSTLGGLGPAFLASAAHAVAPQHSPPVLDYLFLSLGMVPWVWSKVGATLPSGE